MRALSAGSRLQLLDPFARDRRVIRGEPEQGRSLNAGLGMFKRVPGEMENSRLQIPEDRRSRFPHPVPAI